MEIDRNGLEVLGRDESLRLLSTAVLGRIAITSGALPTVLPVNFRYDGRQILIRTGVGTKLSAATEHAVVAFEVDSIDPATETGWSVVVTGMAEEVVDPDDLAATQAVPLVRWAPGPGSRIVAISPDLVSGRRVVGAQAW
jgi:nitroimidazol reductase NimA-like FMN-containing flavoprotein (pyridoxamine 5'-phosphate oxidase superfamily)